MGLGRSSAELRRVGERAVLLTLLLVIGAARASSGQGDRFSHLSLPAAAHPDTVVLMDEGRPREALALLDDAVGQPSLDRLILRATLRRQAGQPVDAEADWRAVIDRAVFMRTFARRALVASLANRGAPAEAAPILDNLLRSDAARHRDLLLLVADAYLDTGSAERAAAAYRRVLAATVRGASADAARLGLAAALEAMDDGAAAIAQLRDAQLRHRTGSTFMTARREARRLALARGEPLAPFAEAEYRDLVGRLRNASRFEPALQLLDAWAAAYPNASAPDRLAVERIETLYAQRDNATAVAVASRFYDTFARSPLLPGVRLTDFRLAVRMGDVDRARRLGRDLWEGRVPGATASQRGAAALLLAAYLGAIGNNDEALALYRGLFQSATAADDQRDMLWRAGVAALRAGQHDRALTNLRGLVSRRPSGDLELAARYWLAVAREQTGEAAPAARTFAALASRYPYHYYGIIARARLDEPREGADPDIASDDLLDFPDLAVGSASESRAEYKAAMALARAGLADDAAWYLRRLLGQHRGDRGLALLAARASAAAGDHASVTRVLVDHFGAFLQRPARGLPDDFWRLVYPRPFWNAVVGSAQTHRADPVLLLSLMRRESRFDPAARSAVGAVGLLQVMPYTAEALAARAGVGHILSGDIDDTTLMDPSVNIAISARLNADLLEMFDGNRLPVIAAYNAGEDHVAEWWAGTRHLRDDFFVDSIPYSETRRFAREVIANYAAYERVYGGR